MKTMKKKRVKRDKSSKGRPLQGGEESDGSALVVQWVTASRDRPPQSVDVSVGFISTLTAKRKTNRHPQKLTYNSKKKD